MQQFCQNKKYPLTHTQTMSIPGLQNIKIKK